MAQQPFMSNPDIVKAYQNDPKTQLAGSMLAQGMSVKPVATGGYAWGDGLARMAQALAGAVMQKQGLKKYQDAERNTNWDLAQAFLPQTDEIPAGFGNQQPAQPQQPITFDAFGFGGGGAAEPGGGAPPQGTGGAPAQAQPLAPPKVPQMPQMAPPEPAAAPAPPMAPSAPSGPPSPSPAVEAAASVLAPRPARAAAQSFAFANPLGPDAMRSSGYGPRGNGFHNGQDFPGDIGDPVHPMAPGVVIAAVPNGGASGNFVKVKHPDGSVTGYAHLSKINVQQGQPVGAGDVIGLVGNTGHVVASAGGDGAHLHLTYRDPSGKLHDPMSVMGHQGTGVAPAGGNTQTASSAPAGLDNPAFNSPLNQPMATAPTTPAPAPIERPQAPALPPAVQSQRLAVARRLMASGNPYLMETARRMAEEGMGEQFTSDREATQRQFDQGQTGYRSGLELANSASISDRNAQWNARANEAQNAFTHNETVGGRQFQSGERIGGQHFQTGERLGAQEFQHTESGLQRTWQGGQNDANRAAEVGLHKMDNAAAFDRTKYTVDGKHEDAATARSAKTQNFLNTPTGAKIGQATSDEVNKSQQMISLLNEYEATAKDLHTGGLLTTKGGAAIASATGDPRYSRLQQITQAMLPMIRMRNDPMSDGDRRAYEAALPNIGQRSGSSFPQIAFMRRMAQRSVQFNMAKLDAQAAGNLPQFLHTWNIYANRVPVSSGKDISYDQWINSIPKVNAQGQVVKK